MCTARVRRVVCSIFALLVFPLHFFPYTYLCFHYDHIRTHISWNQFKRSKGIKSGPVTARGPVPAANAETTRALPRVPIYTRIRCARVLVCVRHVRRVLFIS